MKRRCDYCGDWIETSFGEASPAEHSDTSGDYNDPHAPGDYDNVCAPCNYNLGRQGGPNTWTTDTYAQDFPELMPDVLAPEDAAAMLEP